VSAIRERYGTTYDIREYSFAAALKTEFYDALLNPFDPYWAFVCTRLIDQYLTLPHPANDNASDEEKLAWIEANRPSVVKHLQLYGTDYMRTKDPFCWVRKVRAQIERDNPRVAIISDVRFKNEYAFVKSYRGYTVAVFRHRPDGTLWLDPNRDPNHQSEVDLDGTAFDFTIQCLDGELEDLKRDAYYVFEKIVEAETPVIPDLSDISSVMEAA
jgi:hypothetical protein